MDPRIRIRIHTKMSWIRNTATRPASPAKMTSWPPGERTSRGSSGQVFAVRQTQHAVPKLNPQRSKIQGLEYPWVSRTLRLDPGFFLLKILDFFLLFTSPWLKNLDFGLGGFFFLKILKSIDKFGFFSGFFCLFLNLLHSTKAKRWTVQWPIEKASALLTIYWLLFCVQQAEGHPGLESVSAGRRHHPHLLYRPGQAGSRQNVRTVPLYLNLTYYFSQGFGSVLVYNTDPDPGHFCESVTIFGIFMNFFSNPYSCLFEDLLLRVNIFKGFLLKIIIFFTWEKISKRDFYIYVKTKLQNLSSFLHLNPDPGPATQIMRILYFFFTLLIPSVV